MSIIFNPENHSYLSNENETYISVTRLIGLYKPKFDQVSAALKASKNKKSKWYKIKPEEIVEIWRKESDRSIQLGNWYHNQREKDLLECNSITYDNTILPIFSCNYDEVGCKLSTPQKLEEGVYPEFLLYLPSAGIAGQSDRVTVANGKVDILDYKGLELSTPIPTPNGFKLIKDIQQGDVIFDGDGKKTTVNAVSEIHYNPCYKITFDTGDEIICDHEHKWVITQRTRKGKAAVVSYIEVEKTTEELYVDYLNKEKLRVACISDLETDHQNLPIDPYVLGVWLGDGAKAAGLITNMIPELWKEIQSRGYELGDDISNGSSGKAQSRTILGLYPKLKELGLLHNKHIPDQYLTASRKQRLDLLRGFMDTDGSYNRLRKRCVMVTGQWWQAEGLKTLVASLGWKPAIIKSKTSCTNCKDSTEVDAYHVGFTVKDENPFLVRNQDIIPRTVVKSRYRYITSIEKVDTVPTKCLAVDSPTHTYLATKSYIKTHNTNKEIKSQSFKDYEGISEKMLYPLNHLDNCNLNHYAIQLSIYMYIILKHNPEYVPGKLTLHHIIFEEDFDKDPYGYPIYLKDDHGNFIVKEVVPYNLPYLKDEVIQLLQHYKLTKHGPTI